MILSTLLVKQIKEENSFMVARYSFWDIYIYIYNKTILYYSLFTWWSQTFVKLEVVKYIVFIYSYSWINMFNHWTLSLYDLSLIDILYIYIYIIYYIILLYYIIYIIYIYIYIYIKVNYWVRANWILCIGTSENSRWQWELCI